MTTVTNTEFAGRAGSIQAGVLRPENFPVTNTQDFRRKPNGVDILEKIREQFASRYEVARFENGGQVKELLRKRELSELDVAGFAVDEQEIDLEDLEQQDELEAQRGSNIPIKSEISRLRRALDRGEKLSPSEMDRLGETKLPEAKELIRINQARIDDSKGLTLSPVRALLRSL